MIAEKPKLVVGDIAIVYIRQLKSNDIPNIRSVEVKSVGLTNAVWTFNHGTEDWFTYSQVEYVLRKGKWKNA